MNYISLTHLLELSNTEFSGDAHDPLYDAYNLHILDEVLEKDQDIRNYLIIQDINKNPYNQIDTSIDYKIKDYERYLYHNEGNYTIDELSIDILSMVGRYVYSTRQIKVRNIDLVKDIMKKLDSVDKLRGIIDGYFYVLNNFYLDLMDLYGDALLYKLSQEEYEDEMDNILDLFIEDMEYENIFIDIKVEFEPAESLT